MPSSFDSRSSFVSPDSFEKPNSFGRVLRTKNLGVMFAALLAASAFAVSLRAQESKPADKPAEAPAAPPKEESSVTDHTIKISGQTIPYKATASMILIKNEKDEPTALIYSTAYTR